MIIIRKRNPEEPLPMELLLLADPSAEMVASYAERGECWLLADGDGPPIGAYVLLPTRPATLELVNVAVAEERQGQGLGKRLVLHAVERARELGAATLEVGTGNSSIGQLALYQRCGFRIAGVDRDFFVRHYDEPIVENGIPCVDMIRLSMDLPRSDAGAGTSGPR
ncbi:GNAT family N-acetyltransferase [Paenibacillus sp. FSL W8-1187]|uniref:Acetyltransferase, GNAT family n=1 Tax=Paenibacillus pasadenensis TaxID=217090 RepID=A0A2N5N7Y3_9BACL|nr:GNAT family N-acetyltransferase [Paenibacillus pasadenensis]PLT46433.1 acetyltransferase, GNAT family [Paenibacillus pasadenensis]